MDPAQDPYAVLGVARTAAPAEIARAYRLLVRRFHPDTRHPVDAGPPVVADGRLQAVLTAYAVLAAPGHRRPDDQLQRPSGVRIPVTVHQPTAPQHTPGPQPPPIIAGPVRWHAPRR